jgi:hypothetical protein
MVQFLEERSSHKMNWDKLNQKIKSSEHEMELFRLIY